jgi:hypothetical protein
MSGERTALCTLLMRQSVACPSIASLENIDPRYVCFHIYLLLPQWSLLAYLKILFTWVFLLSRRN